MAVNLIEPFNIITLIVCATCLPIRSCHQNSCRPEIGSDWILLMWETLWLDLQVAVIGIPRVSRWALCDTSIIAVVCNVSFARPAGLLTNRRSPRQNIVTCTVLSRHHALPWLLSSMAQYSQPLLLVILSTYMSTFVHFHLVSAEVFRKSIPAAYNVATFRDLPVWRRIDRYTVFFVCKWLTVSSRIFLFCTVFKQQMATVICQAVLLVPNFELYYKPSLYIYWQMPSAAFS